MAKKSKRSYKISATVSVIVILLAIAVGVYVHIKDKNSSNLINNTASKTVTGTTSKPTNHSVSASTNNSAGVSGGVVDSNGQVSGSLPPASQWVSSDSGNITLQQPSPSSVVKSGDTISGLAKVSAVQFTLTDNSIGLISQGNLSVVGGKFSGTLQFTPHSSGGKLEVYYPDPSNGAEEDIVEINVDFSD